MSKSEETPAKKKPVEKPYTPPQTIKEEIEECRSTLLAVKSNLETVKPPIDHIDLHNSTRRGIEEWVMDVRHHDNTNHTMSFEDSSKFTTRFQNLNDVGTALVKCENDPAKLTELRNKLLGT